MNDLIIGRTPFRGVEPSKSAATPRIVRRTLAIAVMSSAWLAGCSKSERSATAATAPATEKSAAAAATSSSAAKANTAAAPVPEPVRKVIGRWLRADGGYVLELRGADLSGVLDAGYFNPKPINVSRAIWMQGANGFQVVVELNDVGYPGATYVLSHDQKTDRLVGQYTQPAMQQSFDIEFVRQPKP
jgi:hypothetical protein